MNSATLDFRIPFNDCDPMCVVWHGNYLRYFEQVRAELFRAWNFTCTDMFAAGYVFPVAKYSVKYIAPAHFDERVRAEIFAENNDVCLDLHYSLRSLDSGKILAKARSRQVCVVIKTKETLYELPEPLISKIREIFTQK